MENLLNVVRWGNSAGVLLPREWLGKQVKIILIDRTKEIKKEILDILDPYLNDIIGIYLVGSYARNEQRADSDIDIIVISKSIRKHIISGMYNIDIYSLKSIKNTIKKNPIMILPSLFEAKAIINKSLLEELISINISLKNFRDYIKECKRIININKKIIELDKIKGENLESKEIIYSLLLRLRGVYMMNCILKNKKYFNNEFKRWLIYKTELSEEEINKIYDSYKRVKNNKNIKEEFRIELIEKLINLLQEEIRKYGEKIKKA